MLDCRLVSAEKTWINNSDSSGQQVVSSEVGGGVISRDEITVRGERGVKSHTKREAPPLSSWWSRAVAMRKDDIVSVGGQLHYLMSLTSNVRDVFLQTTRLTWFRHLPVELYFLTMKKCFKLKQGVCKSAWLLVMTLQDFNNNWFYNFRLVCILYVIFSLLIVTVLSQRPNFKTLKHLTNRTTPEEFQVRCSNTVWIIKIHKNKVKPNHYDIIVIHQPNKTILLQKQLQS